MQPMFLRAALTASFIVAFAGGCSNDPTGLPPAVSGVPRAPNAQANGTLAALDLDALRALQVAQQPANPFWRDDAQASAARFERLLAAERAARRSVIAALGAAAAEHPAFAALFSPLQDRLPELPAEQQVLISELERTYLAARLREPGEIEFADLLADLRMRLGAAVANEYALRSSPLAAELRSAALDLHEPEFRNAYAALESLQTADDSTDFVTARRALRNALGAGRFVRFWSRRDPGFARLRATAERLSLTEDTLLAAYALLLDNQDAMIAVAARVQRPGGSADTANQQTLRALFDQNRRRLGELAGDEAAEALMLAFAAASGGPPVGVSTVGTPAD